MGLKKTINQIYLSIVVPVFNEEDNVRILYREIRDSVDRIGKPYEIIFVDDGSGDSTSECLTKIIEEEKEENNPNDADVIEMHVKGLSGRDIAHILQEDIAYVEATKKKFIGEKAFYVVLKRFNLEKNFIKRRYNVNYNALTVNERLTYLVRAIREHRDKKSKAQMFAEAGLKYKTVAQWMHNRGVSITEENAEECMVRYLRERKERKPKKFLDDF